MQKPVIRWWVDRWGKLPQAPDRTKREIMLLLLLFRANSDGMLKVHSQPSHGVRLFGQLHTIGFLRRIDSAIQEIVPYVECVQPTSISQRLRKEQAGEPRDYFDSERQPLFGREPGDDGPVESGG